MDGDGYYIDFAGVGNVSDDLATIHNTVINDLQALISAVDQQEASWFGSAFDAWTSVKTIWTTEMNNMQEALKKVGEFTTNTNTQLAAVEQMNTSLFSG